MQLANGEIIVKEYSLVETPDGKKPKRGVPGLDIKVILTNKRVVKAESTKKPQFSSSVEIPVRHVTAVQHTHGKRRRTPLIILGLALMFIGLIVSSLYFATGTMLAAFVGSGAGIVLLGILLFILGLKFIVITSIKVMSMSAEFEYVQRGLEKRLVNCAVSQMIEELPKLIVEEQALQGKPRPKIRAKAKEAKTKEE